MKIIGATAHYVTTDLDEGPIIEQDVQRVHHEHTPGNWSSSAATWNAESSPAPSAGTPSTGC